MQIRNWSIGAAAMALAACGAEAPIEQAALGEPVAIEEELPVIGPERRILAFGDSLFAGYNVAEHEGYPERLEAALRGQGINARVIDAGVSGDTTLAGMQRIGFVLDGLEQKPDLVIVELGGNDFLRGVPAESSRANMTEIVRTLSEREIPTLLMGMRAPPNLGAGFQQDFDSIYPDLAEQFDAALVPFFLEAVYDKPELIQGDRVHPTAEGIEELVAATMGQVAAAIPPVAN